MKPKENDTLHRQKRKKRRRIILLSVLGFLIVLRLVMPYVILRYVNNVLSDMKGYRGHVEDIDLALFRGAYVIHEIKIEKIDSITGRADSIPFFTASKIDLSLQWGAIFKGSLVGDVSVEEPVLNFVKEHHKGKTKADVDTDTSDFRDMIKDLMPLKINYFDIHKGQIHYIDKGSNPKVDVFIKNLEAKATNLTNVTDDSKVLPATIKGKGNLYGGEFELDLKLDALKKEPTFDLNAHLTNVNMVELNNFFKAYGNFDVKRGNLGLYTEFAARNGNFKGYVKPIIKDLDLVQWKKEEGNVLQVMWETILGTTAEIFKNQRKEQLATRIPIKGKFDKTQAGMFEAVVYVLRNAFVYALKPSIDNSVDIGEVEEEPKKNLFQKVFGKKK